jgi:uncharacterized membrane protein
LDFGFWIADQSVMIMLSLGRVVFTIENPKFHIFARKYRLLKFWILDFGFWIADQSIMIMLSLGRVVFTIENPKFHIFARKYRLL